MTLPKRPLAALFATACLLATGAVAAADYPTRAINMVVPFAAGGPTDNVARSLAEAMRTSLGQTAVVENKGGAGGTLGTSQVARDKPDGYSILLMHAGFSTAPSLYKNPGYDPYTSFEPIGLVVDVPMTMLARKDFPANNLQELLAYVKANKDNKGPQAPDVVDVGLAFGPQMKKEGLLQPYKVSTWDEIPANIKDADGYWYGDYYGVMSFLVNKDLVKTSPKDWADLMKPEYAGQVALAGDPRASNQARICVSAG